MPSNHIGSLSQLIHLPMYIINGILYRLSGFLFTPRPRFVCFPVTFQCNSRCQMCNIWQIPTSSEEIDLSKIAEVFSNPLFKKVEEIVLHGGEPTLRKDIKEIYRIVVHACPKLRNIISSTNGLNPSLLQKRLAEILSVMDPRAIQLTFTVSIDGNGASHEKIRGVRGAFERAIKSLEVLKKCQEQHPIHVQIITVIQPQNVEDLKQMENLARQYDVELVFQPLMIDTFYGNSVSDPRLQFSEGQWEKYREFIRTTFITRKDPKSLYWRTFLNMSNGQKRGIPCAYDRYVLSLYPTGEVLPCAKEDWIRFGNVYQAPVDQIWFSKEAKNIRRKMRREVCPTCSFYCGAEYSLKKEFFTYFTYYLKTTLLSLTGISKA